jgi:hypothetical protein
LFKHACFLSYRHSPNSERLYQTFYEELGTQSGLYLPKLPVYFDEARIRGGDIIPEQLAAALCHSVCMVMLFSPSYFDPDFAWCAREYAAMRRLEELRLERCDALSGRSLIIPVVIRGSLPDPIKRGVRGTRCYSLAKDFLAPQSLRRTRVRQTLAELSQDIYRRHEALRSSGVDHSRDCRDFPFPSQEEVQELVSEMATPPTTSLWDDS